MAGGGTPESSFNHREDDTTMTEPITLQQNDSDMTGVEETVPLDKQLEVHAGLLRLAMAKNDRQLVTRVLHHLPRLGALLQPGSMADFAAKYCSDDLIPQFLGQQKPQVEKQESRVVEVYAWLLLTYWLVKAGRYAEVVQTAERALVLCSATGHQRVLDPIQAKLFFYQALGHEKLGMLVDLRHKLMVALRTTSLRHDYDSNAVIYNWILRSYVLCEQHDLASKFVGKSQFPAGANGAQSARYHYYMARVEAVQTNYEAARDHLSQAITKAPHVDASIGLLQSAQKLLVVVQLLLGDIPERGLFEQPKLARPLQPYFALCQAVRLGDLARFQKVLADFHAQFKGDRNDSIITRLHQNVLRAGLKRLNFAYSRIPLAEVSRKLGLPSVDDAEFVVMKAIKDGVIDATVDHAQQFMQSNAIVNSYYTQEPHGHLHHRIQTAQHIYKQSMMAMRYPNGSKPAAPGVDVDSLPNEMDLMEEYMDADEMDF